MTGPTCVGALGLPFGMRLWNHISGRGRKEKREGGVLWVMPRRSVSLAFSFPKCLEIWKNKWVIYGGDEYQNIK